MQYPTLLHLAGRPAEALEILKARIFHPWEGGEGNVPAQYQRALFCLSEAAEPETARALLEQAGTWPDNLGEGKLSANTDNERHLRLGRILRLLGRDMEAEAAFHAATQGIEEPAGAMYYNDQPPETLYFQGLAWRELGNEAHAAERFQKLIAYADTHRNDEITMDYFAVSLPDFLVFDVDLTERNRQHCLIMKALGCDGLGNKTTRDQALHDLLQRRPDHPVKQWFPLDGLRK